MLDPLQLRELYEDEGLSILEIGQRLNVSATKVAYWMNKTGIARRSISDALYKKKHPTGDPFKLHKPRSLQEARLLGLGLGLYLGEGTKSNLHSVRLGNTDPELIKAFVHFLERILGIRREDLHYSLQLFTDIDPTEALTYWVDQLSAHPSQFYKTSITLSVAKGTYRKKSRYGVLTVYYHNKRLRDILIGMLPR